MTEALTVLIADDESIARRRLLRLLQAIEGVEVCGECENGEQVLERVLQGNVDVVLLDIHMPGLDGLDALDLLPVDGPFVIFCTAHSEHAVRAFDGGAVDYLLKPVESARLEKALERVRARKAARCALAKGVVSAGPDMPEVSRLAIPTRDGIVLLDPDEVSHALLEGELVRVFATRGEFLTDENLQALHERLSDGRFMRVHRRALVNLERIGRLDPVETGGFTARTTDGREVPVSRQAARELRRWLGLRKPTEERR